MSLYSDASKEMIKWVSISVSDIGAGDIKTTAKWPCKLLKKLHFIYLFECINCNNNLEKRQSRKAKTCYLRKEDIIVKLIWPEISDSCEKGTGT